MPDLSLDDVLREMGIMRWVLREDNSDSNQTVSETTEQADPPRALAKSAEKPVCPVVQSDNTQVRSMPAEKSAKEKSRIEIGETLETLRTQVAACARCSLAESRTKTVFGDGPSQADWMFIGEAPGLQEDRQGKPFVGRAGQLLTQMIQALGISREAVYIANTLKCRPPDNRDPAAKELQACEAYLLQQIKLVQPKILVALGRVSAQALLNSDQPLGRLRGEIHRYGPDKVPLVATYHPAYLLRKPVDKSKTWADLLLAHHQITR